MVLYLILVYQSLFSIKIVLLVYLVYMIIIQIVIFVHKMKQYLVLLKYSYTWINSSTIWSNTGYQSPSRSLLNSESCDLALNYKNQNILYISSFVLPDSPLSQINVTLAACNIHPTLLNRTGWTISQQTSRIAVDNVLQREWSKIMVFSPRWKLYKMKVLGEYITNPMAVCQDLVLFLMFSGVEYLDLSPIGTLGTGKHQKKDKILINGHRISGVGKKTCFLTTPFLLINVIHLNLIQIYHLFLLLMTLFIRLIQLIILFELLVSLSYICDLATIIVTFIHDSFLMEWYFFTSRFILFNFL